MTEDAAEWTVTAYLFSGRPNPGWKLNKKQSAAWMKHWQLAEFHLKEAQHLPLLGYTGCKLQYDKHSHWFVYNGCVSFYTKDAVINKKDKGKQMEALLLRSAPDNIKIFFTNLSLL